jgi:thiamine biosynthesis lipoprotein
MFCVLNLAACALMQAGSSPAPGSTDTTDVANPAEITKYESTGFAMGTVVDTTLYSVGNDVTGNINDLLLNLETTLLSRKLESSEIAAMNRNARSGAPSEISDALRTHLANAQSLSRNSGGAFDISVGPLSTLWDFDSETNTIPEKSDILSALEKVGYEKFQLAGNTVEMQRGTSVDMGAIGKGIGCDEIQSYLETDSAIHGALVNIGGSSTLTFGSKENEEPWNVAIQNPKNVEDLLGVLTVKGTRHISTSGDYQKYFEKDGRRYFHILDPATGQPTESGLISVTVVADKGWLCDGLSTACFVLGKDKGLELLETYDAQGIFVDENKNVYLSDGLSASFDLLSADFNVVGT